MSTCQSEHRHYPEFEQLPHDQGGMGRHKCCVYERGYALDLERKEKLNIDIDSLPVNQAGTVRHKSPHAAFAIGYQDGIRASYNR